MNLLKRILLFYSRLHEIRKEKGFISSAKIFTKTSINKIIYFPFFLLALLVLCVRPLIKIRFIPLSCLTIGHYVICPELFLCRIDQEENKRREKIIYLQRRRSEVCNVQLYDMWKRILLFPPDFLFHVCCYIEGCLENWCGEFPYKKLLGD